LRKTIEQGDRMSLVGARVIRKEDPNLLTGRGRFVDDLAPTGCLHMAYVRSLEAAALIRGVDLSDALAVDGVVAAYTIDDFAELPPLPSGPEGMDRPVLARERVLFAGEPVAVVVAVSKAIAADAAEAVQVDYESVPVVASIDAALAEGAPLVRPELGTNSPFAMGPDEAMAADVDAALAAAPNTASLRVVNQRCAPSPMEPQGCVADWGPSGLTLWATFQAPHHLRNKLVAYFGIPAHQARVIVGDVGGGFGSKIVFSPEYFLTSAISRKLGQPVKYVQTRSDAMVLTTHGRDQVHDVSVAFDDDGKVLALRLHVVQNVGAHPDATAMGLPVLTTWMASGCYAIPKIAAGFQVCLTNTTPIAAYRGAGRPEAAYMIERVMDLVADRTGLDPAEVRYRNFIQPDQMPYPSVTNEAVVYDAGDYPAALGELQRILEYDALRAEIAENNADPSKPLRGLGLSCWVEIAGFGPNGSLEGFGHLGSWESTSIKIQPDGSAIIAVGSTPQGQGTATTFAQIAADELGIGFDRISVRYGDTETVQQGIGTMGSRGVPVAGEGVKNGAAAIREKAKVIAAHLLEANPDDLEVADDAFHVRGTPTKSITWGEVAWASFQPLEIPEELGAGTLEDSRFQTVPNFSYPSGAYGCVVAIDRATGKITVERYVCIDDCGVVINPLLAEGQVHGGVAQGVAQALFEQMTYDEDGQPLTATLVDYLIPSAADLPSFESGRVVTPTPVNTLGAQGIGESGSVGAPPAVVNAVVDALRAGGADIDHIDMPVTPEKVWSVLRAHTDMGGELS